MADQDEQKNIDEIKARLAAASAAAQAQVAAAQAQAAQVQAQAVALERAPQRIGHEVSEFSGTPNGVFAMYGNFGAPGALTIGGQLAQITAWRDRSIKGAIPAGISGEVEVAIDGVVLFKGLVK